MDVAARSPFAQRSASPLESMQEIDVHFSPESLESESLDGCTVVVTDVLRATTTIVCALAAGARRVLPCVGVEDAREKALALRAVLGGERGGRRVAGFERGNSPLEYTTATVGGLDVVFTTSNGTRALAAAADADADRIYLGAFVNVSAVADAVAVAPRLAVVCAGREGGDAGEDTLFAGSLVARLTTRSPRNLELSARALEATNAWGAVSSMDLADVLLATDSGQLLTSLDLRADVEFAATVDSISCVATYDPIGGVIRLG